MSDTIESTVMAEPKASSSSAILTGMKRGFPIFLGYVPLGFAYGVLAVQNNIPAVYAVLFSLLVYAGAGQFIAVGLWGMGASVFSIVFTTFVINLRHVLMSGRGPVVRAVHPLPAIHHRLGAHGRGFRHAQHGHGHR